MHMHQVVEKLEQEDRMPKKIESILKALSVESQGYAFPCMFVACVYVCVRACGSMVVYDRPKAHHGSIVAEKWRVRGPWGGVLVRRASFFYHSPPVPVLPPLTTQSGEPSRRV